MGFSLVDAAQQFATAAAAYSVDPDEAGAMMQVKNDLTQLSDVNDHIAEGFRAWVTKLNDGYALHHSVLEALHAVYTAQLAVGVAVAQVPATFHVVHADDIARHEAPRTGERGWNVA